MFTGAALARAAAIIAVHVIRQAIRRRHRTTSMSLDGSRRQATPRHRGSRPHHHRRPALLQSQRARPAVATNAHSLGAHGRRLPVGSCQAFSPDGPNSSTEAAGVSCLYGLGVVERWMFLRSVPISFFHLRLAYRPFALS
jgi:hypothetical protein